MKPYEAGMTYPKDHFSSREDAQAWADWASQFLDKRDCNIVEPRAGRWIVSQDLK